VKDWKK